MPREWIVVRLAAPADNCHPPEVRLHVEHDGEHEANLGGIPFTGMMDVTRAWNFIFDKLWDRSRHKPVGLKLTFDVWPDDGILPVLLETVTRIIGHEMEVDVWFGGRVVLEVEQLPLLDM